MRPLRSAWENDKDCVEPVAVRDHLVWSGQPLVGAGQAAADRGDQVRRPVQEPNGSVAPTPPPHTSTTGPTDVENLAPLGRSFLQEVTGSYCQ